MPKLRTGPLQPGLRSVKLRPHKNMLGQVVAPARAWLTAAEDPTEPPDPDLPLLPARRRRPELRDTRGSKRRLVLTADHERSATSDGFEVTAAKPARLAAWDRPQRRWHRRVDRAGRDSPDRTEPGAASR